MGCNSSKTVKRDVALQPAQDKASPLQETAKQPDAPQAVTVTAELQAAPAGPQAVTSAEDKSRGEACKAPAENEAQDDALPVPGPEEEGFPSPGPFNGFNCLAEGPAMTCSEDSIANFTLPAEALVYQPPEDTILTKFKNGDAERKIHNNIKLSEAEMTCLADLRKLSKEKGAAFYPSVTSMASRFISRARNDPAKALDLMQKTQAWREEYFRDGPVAEEKVKEDMKHGIVYFTGRDAAYRPGIVIRAERIPQQWYDDKAIDRFIKVLIFSMEYFLRYMIVPGRVENLSVIVDLNGLGISQVPIGALKDVYKIMSHHYIGRVYKFYVCNMSTALSWIAGMAKAILTDRQKQKLNMLDDVKELRKDFGMNQLEVDLGGSRPNFTSFWPFPVESGPFTAGADLPRQTGAFPRAHWALSKRGAMGRMWDAGLSDEENTRLDYGCRALRVLKACNYPIPASLLEAAPPSKAKPAEESSPVKSAGGSTQPCMSISSQYSYNKDQAGEASPATASPGALTYSNPDLAKDLLFDDVEVGVVRTKGGDPEIQSSSFCADSFFFCCKSP